MSDLVEKVFRSCFGEDAWQRHLGCEQNYKEDCEKFAAMTDAELAETAQHYLNHCERPRWSRGEPVYDAMMVYNILPELIKRLRD